MDWGADVSRGQCIECTFLQADQYDRYTVNCKERQFDVGRALTRLYVHCDSRVATGRYSSNVQTRDK